MNPNSNKFWVGLSVVSAIVIGAILLFKKSGKDDKKIRTGRNIIIGDSQTPLIVKNSKKLQTLGAEGEGSLWQGGKGLAWLKKAVEKYPVTNDVSNVFICIGTNGGFNKSDDINGLVKEIRRAFPNAELFAVQGSWGWGKNKNISEAQAREYYLKFKHEAGVTLVQPPIGKLDDKNSHNSNLPIYKTIGQNIDEILTQM